MVAELSLRIAGGPDAPAEVRTALRRAHPELPPRLMQLIVLLASELVSNAVRHAEAESISVRFEVVPRTVRLEVGDDGPGFRYQGPTPHPSAIGGWGLYLVDELSSRWGIADGDGTRVWFEIDR